MASVANFQDLILSLINYWVERGCVWSQPYDAAMGAGTFHPHTFLKGVGPEPWRSVYVQPCRRPVDGRYGESPYRFQHYYQLQVLLKPAPADIVDVYLKSLESVGIRLKEHDIGLLEDDWKGPTLGAWGLGWEVRANGQEITQFTYFQQLGGMDVDVVCGEITYGLERLFMYAKGLKNGLEMPYNDTFTYGDVFRQAEFEFSHLNFEQADVPELLRVFSQCESEVARLCEQRLVLPAYDCVLQASHAFNMLDARGALSVGERQRYIGRVRETARLCAELYRSEREKLGFPMMERMPTDARLNMDGSAASVAVSSGEGPVIRSEGDPACEFATAPLLIEYGVEELPPAFQQKVMAGAQKLADLKKSLLLDYGANGSFKSKLESSGNPELFVTQRRLVLSWKGLPAQTPRLESEVWGPAERIALADGKLTKAGEGFCRKNGLDPERVELREREDGRFLHATRVVEAKALPELVLEAFEDFLLSISFPLKMKWLPESVGKPFVRPVRWILALHGSRHLSWGGSCFGLAVGATTSGQRITSPEPLRLSHADEYFDTLKSKGVVLGLSERRAVVLQQAQELLKAGASSSARLAKDEALELKCAGLSESPFVFVGKFPEVHLRLPDPLIRSVLRDHMNFFSVEDGSGELLPQFVGVANYRPSDVEGMVEAAAEVVIGRLADGTFYFDGDLKTDPKVLLEKLEKQVFQSELGSLADKSRRIAAAVVTHLGSVSVPPSESAAQLAALHCKMDLQTGCVAEFPDEMQGVMGGVLLRRSAFFAAEAADVREVASLAVEQHYAPAGQADSLPSSPLGCLLSFADKWDTVCSLMARGDRVKGNKDPFGLRRNCLAVLRLAGLDGDPEALSLTLGDLLNLAQKTVSAHGLNWNEKFQNDLLDFVVGRMEAQWKSEFSAGAIRAVLSLVRKSPQQSSQSSLTISQSRSFLEVLDTEIKKTDSALAQVMASYKRCKNILSKNSKEIPQTGEVDPTRFEGDAEGALKAALEGVEQQSGPLIDSQNFSGYLAKVSELAAPLAFFFDSVMVMAEDSLVRANRLLLLKRVLLTLEKHADFSAV